MRVRLLNGILLTSGLAIAVAGCGKHEEPDARMDTRHRKAAPPALVEQPPFDPLGTWTVVGHYAPGISTMSEDEARAHDGQTVKFAASETLSNGERCTAPKYPVRPVDTEDFLAEEFNLPPESLKPLAGKESVAVVEISCNGAPWTAFGSLVIAIDADHVLAPWDGVFFELEHSTAPGS